MIWAAVSVTVSSSPGRTGRAEAQLVQPVVGEHRPRLGGDEQPGGERQHEVAVGDDAAEQRVGGRRFLVGVGVERVAGELGEVLDVGAVSRCAARR